MVAVAQPGPCEQDEQEDPAGPSWKLVPVREGWSGSWLRKLPAVNVRIRKPFGVMNIMVSCG